MSRREEMETTIVRRIAIAVGAVWGILVLGGTILATVDGGTTWQRQYSGLAPIAQFDVLSPSVVWAATSHGLLGTTDGGRHWTMLSTEPTVFRMVDFVTPNEGWAVVGGANPEVVTGPPSPFEGGQLMKTVDGGHTWTLQARPIWDTPADVQSICFSDAKHGWLGSDMSVWQTTDGGSWEFLWQAPLKPEGHWDARVGCAGPSVVWVLFVGEAGAANHKPYVLY